MDYTKIDKYLGNKLRDARLLKRMSLQELSKMISQQMTKKYGYKKGISYQALAFYEKGERSMPEHVFSIACKLLDLDEVLLFNEGLEYIKKEEK